MFSGALYESHIWGSDTYFIEAGEALTQQAEILVCLWVMQGAVLCPVGPPWCCVCGLGHAMRLSRASSPLLPCAAASSASKESNCASATGACDRKTLFCKFLACASKWEAFPNALHSLDLFWTRSTVLNLMLTHRRLFVGAWVLEPSWESFSPFWSMSALIVLFRTKQNFMCFELWSSEEINLFPDDLWEPVSSQHCALE